VFGRCDRNNLELDTIIIKIYLHKALTFVEF
jgi:hypothetical protein